MLIHAHCIRTLRLMRNKKFEAGFRSLAFVLQAPTPRPRPPTRPWPPPRPWLVLGLGTGSHFLVSHRLPLLRLPQAPTGFHRQNRLPLLSLPQAPTGFHCYHSLVSTGARRLPQALLSLSLSLKNAYEGFVYSHHRHRLRERAMLRD